MLSSPGWRRFLDRLSHPAPRRQLPDRGGKRGPARRPGLRLQCEYLEDRTLLTTTTAVSLVGPALIADSGAAGSFAAPFAISPDGRYVAFQSSAGNLVAGASNGLNQIFVRDTVQGTTALASADAAGIQGNGNSADPALLVGANGHVLVAFDSSATNLVPGGTNGTNDVFVKDLTTGTVTLASTDSNGNQGNDTSSNPALAVDGSGHILVAFGSFASNLVPNDTNGTEDVFVKDLTTGATSLASTDSNGNQGNGPSFSPDLILDGSGHVLVAFASQASNLVPNDTNGTTDVFVKDLSTGAVTLASSDSSGNEGNSDSDSPALALGGNGDVLVAFESDASNLVPNDTNGAQDVFVKDLTTGGVTLASTTSSGNQGNNASFNPALAVAAGGTVYVAFTSAATNLVPNGTNGANDVFVKDLTTGATTLASSDSSGNQGNGDSSGPALAVDAGGDVHVAFQSDASNLVPNDTNGSSDVFLKDLGSGATQLVSRRDPGLPQLLAGFSSAPVALSPGGRYVAFESSAANLVSGDTNGVSDIFVRDTLMGTTTRISTDGNGNQANGASFVPAITEDSSGNVYVAFESSATNLAPNATSGTYGVFVKDLTTGTTTLASADSSGNQGNAAALNPALTVDGSGHVLVAFTSSSTNLVPGNTNGHAEIFVKDLTTGAVTLASADGSGTPGNADSDGAALAVGGSGHVLVAFGSTSSNLVPNDTNGAEDVFVKDLTTGAVTRASTDGSGNQGNADSFAPSLAVDGSGDAHVAFESSATNLVPNDANNADDVFVKDLGTGAITLASSDSKGNEGNAASSSPSLAVDGSGNLSVAFASLASNLVPNDTNGVSDVFVKDLTTGAVSRVSTDSNSNQANDDSSGPALAVDAGGNVTVAFASDATNLVGGDYAGRNSNIYLWSTSSAGSALIYNASSNPTITDYTLLLAGGTLEVVETANLSHVLGSRPLAATSAVLITAQDGAANRLTVDYPPGFFNVPVTFTGGTGPGTSDALRVLGTGSSTGTYTPSGTTTGSGNATVTDSGQTDTIAFGNVKTAEVTGMAGWTFQTPGPANVLSVSAGTGSNGQAADVISGTSNSVAFDPLTFNNVTNFTLDTAGHGTAGAAGDSITVTSAGLSATGLQNFVVQTGPNNDTFEIDTPDYALPVAGGGIAFDGGAGTNTFVGADRTGAGTGVTYSLADTGVTSGAGGGGTVSLTNVTQADLVGGGGDDTFNVAGWTGQDTLAGGAGNDVYNVTFNGSGTATTVITAGPGTANQANVTGTNRADNFTITDTQTTLGGESVRYTTGVQAVAVNGTPAGQSAGDNDTFNVTPSTATTFTINAGDGITESAPGDVLNIDTTGIAASALGLSGITRAGDDVSGKYTFAGQRAAITFNSLDQVTPTADLAVTVAATPASPQEGGTIAYSLAVTNAGPSDDTNVILTDAVPTGAAFVSSTFTGYDPKTGQANLGTVSSGGTVLGTIVVRVPEEGTYSDQASVSGDLPDPDTSNNSQTVQTAVSDPAVAAVGGFTVTATEGEATGQQVVARFTDPAGPEAAGDYSATIAWGDGMSSAGTVSAPDANGVFTVTGSHTYAEESAADHAGSNPYVITVTIGHDKAPTATALSSATASDPAAAAVGGFTVTAAEGADSGLQTVATFTDPGGAEALADYSASITWGDGTAASAGTITFNAGTGVFTVQGSHTYAEESAVDHPNSNPYAVTVTIGHEKAPTATATSSATVSDPAVAASGGFTITAVEGSDSGLQTVATFTDTAGTEALADYSASIDWGDGTAASAGTITFNAGTGTFTVQGGHTYAEESAAGRPGSNPYAVTVTISHEKAPTATATSSATVSDPAVAATGGFTVTATEGADSGLQTVATFTDPAGAEALADYSASITWGDGTASSAGTITFNAGTGTFTVQGSHTYAEESAAERPGSNPYAVTVTVSHDSAPTATTTSSASVSDDAVAAAGGFTVTAVEAVNSGLQTVATFTDPGGAEALADYSATIDWGDRTAASAGTISVSSGVFTVQGSHTYAEESAARRPGSNPYAVTVTVSHDGAPTATATSSATVSDPAVAATGGFTVTAVEGTDSGLQTVATFTDPAGAEALADYSASITWGDGTAASAGTITFNAGTGTFTVQASHTYAEESAADHPNSSPYTVTVTVSHDGAPTATATSSATVSDPAVVVAGGFTVTATEGTDSGPQTVATFTDPVGAEALADYSATIDWGDNSGTTAGTLTLNNGVFTVTGSHLYAKEGQLPVTVTVSHDGAPTAMATGTAAVGDATLSASGLAVQATEGSPFSGPVATFTDAGGAEATGSYTVTIDWGDGKTTPGTVTLSGSTFTVAGSHTYAKNGSQTVKVSVRDEGGATISANSTATIADADLMAQGASISPEEAAPFSGTVATFTDDNPGAAAGDFSATIDWGDGIMTTGTVSAQGTGFQVTGQHAYPDDGTFPVTVTIRDTGGSTATAHASAAVSNPGIGLQVPSLVAPETVPEQDVIVATFTHGSGGEDPARFSATIDWGDGTTTAGTVTRQAGGTYAVRGSHTYADEARPGSSYVMTVRVSDGTVSAGGSAVVAVQEASLPPGAPAGTADLRFLQELYGDVFGVPASAATLNRLNLLLHPAGHRHRHGLSRARLVSRLLTRAAVRALHGRAAQAGGGTRGAALVTGYYKLLLDGPPAPQVQLQAQRTLKRRGEQALIASILSSPDYYNKTAG